MIKDFLIKNTDKKVVLLNEIIQVTTKTSVKDSNNVRKDFVYLRDLVDALCDFNFEGNFYIPNSWISIGKKNNLLQNCICSKR